MHGAVAHVCHLTENHAGAVFAVLVTLYYWWQNIMGIEESSDKALRVMKITTVMVVILLAWSAMTLVKVGIHLPPWPSPSNFHFSDEALGFLKGTNFARTLRMFGILIA